MPKTLIEILREFGETLTSVFSSSIPGDPEDQLKAPMLKLLREAGKTFGYEVEAKTESRIEGLGARPDLGVGVNKLLNGYLELKAPGLGAHPEKFKEHSKEQWEKFKALPNIIYTDGNEWSLYRTGKLEGKRIRFTGDIREDGVDTATEKDAEEFERLLRDFFSWEPTVPANPRQLAKMLAPLCRILRDDVMAAVSDESSDINALAKDWREILFPDADDWEFSDAYAQTVTYTLLLAKLDGLEKLNVKGAVDSLEAGHTLLSKALQMLADAQVRKEIGLGIDLLERSIGAVDAGALRKASKGVDPWLYFYEDFLAEYDPKLRNDRGVYYTPVEVVKAQVNIVIDLLINKFDKKLGFASEDVIVLDPAAGTGTYPLAVIEQTAELIKMVEGEGAVPARITALADKVNAFEIMVGPYSVAHLRVTEALERLGGSVPKDGVGVYLTDTLESPFAETEKGHTAPLFYKPLAKEHERARKIKANTRVLVCLGNPPYNRQEIDPEDEKARRKGGWVRYGDKEHAEGRTPILEDFIAPARAVGAGVHLKNIYNDYVYFWRWALWKVFESNDGPGIVTFITASSYLRGPGFVGMREHMRRVLDEIWIFDLEGDSHGARKTENIFNIQTPVAIAIGVRYGEPHPNRPAKIHCRLVSGSRNDKLRVLGSIKNLKDAAPWVDCHPNWIDPFTPNLSGNYFAWPKLTDLFPWQQSGVKSGRTWHIAPIKDLIIKRWKKLVTSKMDERATLFKNSPTGKKINDTPPSLLQGDKREAPVSQLKKGSSIPQLKAFGWRSFDRQWIIADSRFIDRPSPPLWRSNGAGQIFLTTLITDILGDGSGSVVTHFLPDLHHFSGRGAKDTIPLWRDREAKNPNITRGLLETLKGRKRSAIAPEDLLAYSYAVLASPAYTDVFRDELLEPGPRVPITKDTQLFKKAVEKGRELIRLHTNGERFSDDSKSWRLTGSTKCTKPIPTDTEKYPEEFSYDPNTRELKVGEGVFAPVDLAIWDFSVSGLKVLHSWLSYRMKKGAGKKSSPLDDIRPERWTAEMTADLLNLLWTLERTIAMYPDLKRLLDKIVASETFSTDELPQPTDEERKPPKEEEEEELQKDLDF